MRMISAEANRITRTYRVHFDVDYPPPGNRTACRFSSLYCIINSDPRLKMLQSCGKQENTQCWLTAGTKPQQEVTEDACCRLKRTQMLCQDTERGRRDISRRLALDAWFDLLNEEEDWAGGGLQLTQAQASARSSLTQSQSPGPMDGASRKHDMGPQSRERDPETPCLSLIY